MCKEILRIVYHSSGCLRNEVGNENSYLAESPDETVVGKYYGWRFLASVLVFRYSMSLNLSF